MDGYLDEEALQDSLNDLPKRHPMLGARLAGARLKAADRVAVTLGHHPRRDETSWKEIVERELVTPFDESRAPLFRAALISSGGSDRWEVIVTFHHAVVDGQAALQVLRELLADEALPTTDQPIAQDLPPSADRHLPPPYRWPYRLPTSLKFLAGQMREEIAYRRAAIPQKPVLGRDYRCRVLTEVLTLEETEALVRATRLQRITVTALLEAALLLAVLRRRYPGGERPHRFFTFPLLRSYLQPPIPGSVVGSYLSTLRLTVTAAPDSDLWTLAQEVHHRIHSAARRGEKFLAGLWAPFSMRAVFAQRRYRMATSALSYTGATPFPKARDGAELLSLHAFVSTFPHAPEYAAQARLHRRRLLLDFVYLDVDMDEREARQIAGEMHRLLVNVAPAPDATLA